MARSPKCSASCRAAMLVLSVLLGTFLLAVPSPSVAAAGPSLAILAPANDQVIDNGTPVILSFAVANFVLVQPGRVGQVSNPGEGHVDLYIDGAYSRLLTRVEPVSLPLGSGPHTIRLQLIQDNGTPLSPDIYASVRIVATHGPAVGTPTITIVSPKPGPTIAHDVYFAVEVTNFTLVDSYGQPNAPNEGHESGAARIRSGVHRRHARWEQHGHRATRQQRQHRVESRRIGERHDPDPRCRRSHRVRTGDRWGFAHPRAHLARPAPPPAKGGPAGCPSERRAGGPPVKRTR